jgi:hypothetical protein
VTLKWLYQDLPRIFFAPPSQPQSICKAQRDVEPKKIEVPPTGRSARRLICWKVRPKVCCWLWEIFRTQVNVKTAHNFVFLIFEEGHRVREVPSDAPTPQRFAQKT